MTGITGWVVVVSYISTGRVHSTYGPYGIEAAADAASHQMRALPGVAGGGVRVEVVALQAPALLNSEDCHDA